MSLGKEIILTTCHYILTGLKLKYRFRVTIGDKITEFQRIRKYFTIYKAKILANALINSQHSIILR